MVQRVLSFGFIQLLSALLILLLLSSCSSGVRWYKDGRYQADFDRDAVECEIIAREHARQATMTGDREDLATLFSTLSSCLYRKGWSHQPPGQQVDPDSQSPSATPLAAYTDGVLRGFGPPITLPPGFVALVDQVDAAGPTVTHSHFFMGPDLATFVNIIYQRTFNDIFLPVAYPVAPPFFLYQRDRGQCKRLRWAVFAGEFQQTWVAGFGAYLPVNRRERITVIVTRELPLPEQLPPPGLRLSPDHREAVEFFSWEWRNWATAFAPCD